MPGCKFHVGLMQLTMQLCSESHSIKSVLRQLFSTITIAIANLSASPAVALARFQVLEIARLSCINQCSTKDGGSPGQALYDTRHQ